MLDKNVLFYKKSRRLVLFMALLSLSTMTIALDSEYPIRLKDLVLSQNASEVTVSNPDADDLFPFSHKGFSWDTLDAETFDWRPQGITVFSKDAKSWAAVTWYDRRFHSRKGVRVSFVNLNATNNVHKYTHVLLLDRDMRPLSGVHAGGVVYRKGKLFIPIGNGNKDTKSTDMYTFSVDSILEVDANESEDYFDFQYVLPQNDDFDYSETTNPENNPYHLNSSDTQKPSFLSFDWDREAFVTGSYYRCVADSGVKQHVDDSDCLDDQNIKSRTLSWYNVDFNDKTTEEKGKEHFFTEMQGAASTTENLWISSSYSSYYPSHLHVVKRNTSCDNGDQVSGPNAEFCMESSWCEIRYPAGLEDLNVTSNANAPYQNLWMLTEFATSEGDTDNAGRFVFAIHISEITYDKIFSLSVESNSPSNISCH